MDDYLHHSPTRQNNVHRRWRRLWLPLATITVALFALAVTTTLPAAAAPSNQVVTCDMATLGANVDTFDKLSSAIECYNVTTVVDNYEINITNNISLTASTQQINNNLGLTLQINGNGNFLDGKDSFRGLLIAADTTVTVDNLVIQNGAAGRGGGIGNSGTLTVTNQSVIRNSRATRNSGAQGGGILNLTGGHLIIVDSSIVNNWSKHHGGGVHNQSDGTVEIHNSTIMSNTAQNKTGGGILNTGQMTIKNSRILANTANNMGAISQSGVTATTTVTNSCIVGNSSIAVGRINTPGGGGNNIIANDNWWGHSSGPTNLGAGEGDAIGTGTGVTVDTFLLYEAAACATPLSDLSQLTVLKSASPVVANNGDTVTYTIQIANDTGAHALDLDVTDVLPTEMNYTGGTLLLDPATAGTIGGLPNLVTDLDVAIGETVTLTYKATVNTATEQALVNTVEITNTAAITGALTTATIDVNVPTGCDVAALGAAVTTVTALNEAITCYNSKDDQTVYTINLDGDILLSDATTEINNSKSGMALFIMGNGNAINGDDTYRGLTIAANTHVTLDNLTIHNGQANRGGGIKNNGTLTITNQSIIRDNNVIDARAHGGGIDNDSGSLIIIDSTVLRNSSVWHGGGIHNRKGAILEIRNSDVLSNTAPNNLGGGILNSGQLTINDSRLLENTAKFGGAVNQANNASTTITNSCIVDNSDIAIRYVNGPTIVATDNWWGHASGAFGSWLWKGRFCGNRC